MNDVYNDNDNHHFHFEIDYSGKATFRQANAPKWNWLHSGYVIGNLKALQDTLRKCECMQKKDESFIENALQHVKAEEEKVNTLEKESKINGTDMFMDGVELVSKEIVFNPDMEPSLPVEIHNNTKVEIVSVEIVVSYCKTQFDKSIKVIPECYQKYRLKTNLQPLSTVSTVIRFDNDKYNSRSFKPKAEITRIVKANGELVEKRNAYEFSE